MMDHITLTILLLTSSVRLQFKSPGEETKTIINKLSTYYFYNINLNEIVSADNTHWQNIDQISFENPTLRVMVIFY